ncbi:MAG TPA: ATP-binding protein [Acidimicrobiales bacterium]|nr:ATP-binding protein [Acidimicrobiales bacterium]
MKSFERKFRPELGELPAARGALRAWLHDVGVEGEDATADVLVVASELVTNGVFHDGGDLITVRADKRDGEVAVEVTTVDHVPGYQPPDRDLQDPLDGGRGLAIVRALSREFSVVQVDDQRVTTCRITTD